MQILFDAKYILYIYTQPFQGISKSARHSIFASVLRFACCPSIGAAQRVNELCSLATVTIIQTYASSLSILFKFSTTRNSVKVVTLSGFRLSTNIATQRQSHIVQPNVRVVKCVFGGGNTWFDMATWKKRMRWTIVNDRLKSLTARHRKGTQVVGG